MTNNLQFIEMMGSIAKSNARRKLNIQLACFGVVAVAVAGYYIYQNIQQTNKAQELVQQNDYLRDVISSCNVKMHNLEQQIYYTKETIEKIQQPKSVEA